MSSRSERGTAVAYGMSGRIVTPDSPLPDLLDGYPEGEGESELDDESSPEQRKREI